MRLTVDGERELRFHSRLEGARQEYDLVVIAHLRVCVYVCMHFVCECVCVCVHVVLVFMGFRCRTYGKFPTTNKPKTSTLNNLHIVTCYVLSSHTQTDKFLLTHTTHTETIQISTRTHKCKTSHPYSRGQRIKLTSSTVDSIEAMESSDTLSFREEPSSGDTADSVDSRRMLGDLDIRALRS